MDNFLSNNANTNANTIIGLDEDTNINQAYQIPIQQQMPMQYQQYQSYQQMPIQQPYMQQHNGMSNSMIRGSTATTLGPALDEWRKSEELIIHSESQIGTEKIQGDIKLRDALKFGGQLEKLPIVQSDTPVKQAMLLSIEETLFGELDIDTCKADVICIIDVSGSMAGQKLDYVRKTLTSLLDFLKGSRMAIVTFSCEAEMLMNFKIVNDDNLSNIQKIIDSLHDQGNTNITHSVKVSQGLLKARFTKNEVASLFLLSDGQHNQGEISNEIMFDGDIQASGTEYTLHTFGYGDDHDSKLMQSMSERKHGNYYFVNDITKVDECFADCMGMVTTSLATKGKLTLKLQPTAYYPEVRILKTYGPYWQKTSDTEATIMLSSIYAGIKKDFGLEIEFDASKKQVEDETQSVLATLKLEYTEMGASESSMLEESIKVSIYPKGSQVAVVTNLEVKKNIMRAVGGDAIKKAHENNAQGQNKEGIEFLKGLKTEFEKADDVKDDAIIASLIKQFDEIIKMLDNDMHGRANACKSSNYMMQQANMYCNQVSAPQYEHSSGMFQNMRQSANVISMKSKKSAF